MTGNSRARDRRLPYARRVICAAQECKRSFIVGRRLQVYCSDGCRKAESRRQEALENARKAFKTVMSIAENTAANAYDRAWNASYAMHLGRYHTNVAFMGVPHGVLAIEKVPAALDSYIARETELRRLVGSLEREYIETRSTDPRVIAVVGEQRLDISYIRREPEDEFRKLLETDCRVVLFPNSKPRPAPRALPICRSIGPTLEDVFGPEPAETSEYVGEYDIDVIFPNGGWSIGKK